jgi:bisphosphoglycerate-independent phosphoglycerate mutase (AlkP superfamily)
LKVLFLFIDGVGLRGAAADNPVNPEVCPTLCRLVEKHSKPIDACLGVEGLPQSATGQATMFTGVNCASAMGRHCEGFPGPALRAIIEKSNLFLQLEKRGRKVAFADAYLVDSADELASRRFKSVTTVMALTVPKVVLTADDLMEDRALMQDLTRETIQDRYPDVATIPPQRAAEHLFAIAQKNDFTLYEFFQTDVSGHSLDYARACAVLRMYDRFLATLARFTEAAGMTLVITSDHGNVECMAERGHTRNPVPFIAFGPREERIRAAVSSLKDVTPAILAEFDSPQ